MNSKVWLNIGCGKKHIEGFVNMDIVKPYDKKLDARKGLPYIDSTVDGIYSEHFFEHLTQKEGLTFLRECRRVLKPNGRIRIAMPDLDSIISRYNSEDWRGDGDMFKLGFEWVQNRCEMLNIAMREWGHKHVYNEQELIRIASMAGLRVIKRYENGKSDIPEFNNLETRNSSKLIMEFSLQHISNDKFPLVSILIPAYNPQFFLQTIKSAIKQSYSNIEIIITDDSESNEIENITNSFSKKDANITYIRNKPAEGGLNNYLKLFSLSKGEFIKFLNDDDILNPNCVEKMMTVFIEKPNIKLVTSYRPYIKEDGSILPNSVVNAPFLKKDCEIEGVSCANAICSFRTNFIGEPTTVMFRKSDLSWVEPNFMSYSGTIGYGGGDVAMWLNLLGRGNAYYFIEPLSQTRVHHKQRRNNPEIRQKAIITWWKFISHARRLGLMESIIPLSIKIRTNERGDWKRAQVITTGMFLRAIRFWAQKAFNRYVTKDLTFK